MCKCVLKLIFFVNLGWMYIVIIVKMGILFNIYYEEFWEYIGWDID